MKLLASSLLLFSPALAVKDEYQDDILYPEAVRDAFEAKGYDTSL